MERTTEIVDHSVMSAELSSEEMGFAEEIPEDTILSNEASVNISPFIGQRFISQDAAYEYYCSFAKQCGFSIRRHRTRGKDGIGRGITRRDFTCHRSGFSQTKKLNDNKVHRNRKSSRCGCAAYMRIVKKTDFDVPEWRIIGFSNIHNHELLKSDDKCVLRAHCSMSLDDKSRICMFAKVGMSVRQMLRLIELEKGVKPGCLPFMEIDVRNLLKSLRNVDRDNDAIDLVSMCKRVKDKYHNFKYEFKIDGLNRLEQITWSYASSIRLYDTYGDAVIFDTTHRLDAYDMVLGIWIGVDSHGMNCFFGCSLLREESVQSFAWALKTFLGFMKGKAPLAILTDQNMLLKEAVSIEMPDTKHAFCIWHILSKFSNWFSILLGSHYDNWKTDFIRLYNLDTKENFEVEWRETVDHYALHTNKHVANLYGLRAFWALPFLRCYFFAGMSSTIHAETIDTFIQRFLTVQSQLENFVEQAETIVKQKDLLIAEQESERKLNILSLKTGSPIESHAASILTPFAFSKLQEEIMLSPQYALFPREDSCFIVRHHKQVDGGFKVIWQPHEQIINCTCLQFEFSGILCKHVLRVLSTSNCFQIPDEYLPSRWRIGCSPSKEHTERVHILESMISDLISESMESEGCLGVASEQIELALSRVREISGAVYGLNDIGYCSPSETLILEDSDSIIPSLNMGNSHDSSYNNKSCTLKERRESDGIGMSKKKRQEQFGHDNHDCSIIESEGLSGDDLGFL